LAPRVHQSANTIYNGRITKEGSPRVRWALVQAARSAVRWDDHYRTKYQRIKERRGDGKAIVAIAREITVAMYPCRQVGLANPQIVQSFYHTAA